MARSSAVYSTLKPEKYQGKTYNTHGGLSRKDSSFFQIAACKSGAGDGLELMVCHGEEQQGREAGCQQAAHTKREASGCGKYRVLWVQTVRCCWSILHDRASNIFSRGAQGCYP